MCGCRIHLAQGYTLHFGACAESRPPGARHRADFHLRRVPKGGDGGLWRASFCGCLVPGPLCKGGDLCAAYQPLLQYRDNLDNRSMLVIGVDGCKGGWVAAALGDSNTVSVTVHKKFADLLSAADGASWIGVDIPIGLPADGVREADRLARIVLLPTGRANSVFITPPREALEADTHAQGSAICKRLTGVGMSQQAYALRKKIFEVAPLAAEDPRIFEVHPEVSFFELTREFDPPVLLPSKKTWHGMWARWNALQDADVVVPTALGAGGLSACDDVLDAAVAARTARRKLRGLARSLPAEPESSRTPTIWY